jgi:hypothetical protein
LDTAHNGRHHADFNPVRAENTLNKITVSGEDNLSMLLACINTVEQMIEEER